MKKEAKAWIWIVTAIYLVSAIYAFKTNSTNYVNKFEIDSGSETIASSNYNNTLSIPFVGGRIISSAYHQTAIGFMHTVEDIGPTFRNNATNSSAIKVNDWVRFNVTCTDGNGIAGFIFSHNNSRDWSNESYIKTDGNYSIEANFSLQITLVQTDTFGWRFICNDTVGNIGFMDTAIIDLSNVAPSIPLIINPAEGAYIQRLDINYSSFDADNDIINYTVFINGTYNLSSRYNISNLSVADGVYNLSVSAYDGIEYSRNSSAVFTKDSIFPDITLITPINRSGDNDGNITFEYTVADTNNITNCSLYINDRLNLTNTTITKNIYQNLTVKNMEAGSYNWSVMCIDIANNNATTGNRIVAVIKTTKFGGETTTDFSTVNVFALPNLILENPDYGKISLIETVDLGIGADFDSYLNMRINRITINSTMLPRLNFSSDILFYNLTFNNPQILKNDGICAECAKKSYANGTLALNVTTLVPYNITTLTTYSARETPVPAPAAEAAAGGGGAGAVSPAVLKEAKYDFRLDKNEIKTKLKIGKDIQKSLEIRNLGTGKLTFNIDIEDVKDFVSVSDYSFELDVGERKTIILNIVGKKFGVFIGKLIAMVSDISKSIPLIIEVESEKALFDVKLDIPAISKKVAPGDKLKTQITLFNVIGSRVDVIVTYLIKDLKGNVISEENEKFSVETQSSYVRVFDLPPDIEPGKYIAAIEVRYANSYAVSSQMFDVVTKEELLALEEARTRVLSIFFIVAASILTYAYILTKLVKRRKR